MSILVTGATGFLGSSLVTELVKRRESTPSVRSTQQERRGGIDLRPGGDIRILARDEQKARQLFGSTVTVIGGEITNKDAVKRAVAGVTTIFHLVGRLYHPSVPMMVYRQTHVEGTRTILDACLGERQLQRFVHCSTTGVHGVTGTTAAAEDAPFAPTNPYEATKLESELLAMQAFEEKGLPVSVVRPGLVYGPGDLHLLSFFKTIKKGLFPVLIDGGKALIHPVYIDDVTAAFFLCAEREEAVGHSYNIAGTRPVSFREFSTAIAHAIGKKPTRGSIPLGLANLASDIFAALPGFAGERAPLTRSRVQFLTKSRIYTIERARKDLGYEPRVGLEEGMRLTALWYQKQGYL